MNLETTSHGATLVVQVTEDRIDASCAIQFKDAMQQVDRTGADRVILDLSKVNFLDSSGLGAVVAVMKMYAPETRLELAGLTQVVEKVFRLTRMDQVFQIHNSAGEGLEAA